MKIRNGFVSNSSSTSFCILGSAISYEDIVNSSLVQNVATLSKTLQAAKLYTGNADDVDIYEYTELVEQLLEYICKQLGLGYYTSANELAAYIGYTPDLLKNSDLSIRQLTEAVTKQLRDAFPTGQQSVDLHYGEIYNE